MSFQDAMNKSNINNANTGSALDKDEELNETSKVLSQASQRDASKELVASKKKHLTKK